MTHRSVMALGVGQCVSWGVLYYAFAVLVLPLERELGVPTWVVTGAFSVALLMAAVAAPAIGRWGDRGGAPTIMQLGGVAASLLLAVWALFPNLWSLYLVWAALGLCMAATLYEPAFVIVGRAFEDPVRRLRALAAVTLFGGLASTVFLPVTASLVAAVGWRQAVLLLAAVLALTTYWLRFAVFERRDTRAATETSPPAAAGAPPPRTQWLFVTAAFAGVSLAGAAFTANLVPALHERGIPPATAAVLGGLIGVMQLPGRVLLLHGVMADRPAALLGVSLLLHAVGFGLMAAAASVAVIAAATAVFALGAGLTSLIRPHLVQTLYGAAGGGYRNGRVARHQQLARAGGPILAAWAAQPAGYAPVFALMAVLFAALAVASHAQLRPQLRH